jgi:hypothetical protein
VGEVIIPADQAEDCRRAWSAGLCPCCSSRLHEWPGPNGEDVFPEMVAEGVIFCGRCIGNNHHTDPPGFLEAMLEALIP